METMLHWVWSCLFCAINSIMELFIREQAKYKHLHFKTFSSKITQCTKKIILFLFLSWIFVCRTECQASVRLSIRMYTFSMRSSDWAVYESKWISSVSLLRLLLCTSKISGPICFVCHSKQRTSVSWSLCRCNELFVTFRTLVKLGFKNCQLLGRHGKAQMLHVSFMIFVNMKWTWMGWVLKTFLGQFLALFLAIRATSNLNT